MPIPKHAPFAIGYALEGKPHDYLPDVVGTLSNGKVFIAEAGMEDDKRQDRNLAKAEAARHLARLQRGVYWIATEKTLTRQRHYNLVFLHARRQVFPAFADIAVAVQEVWPWGISRQCRRDRAPSWVAMASPTGGSGNLENGG